MRVPDNPAFPRPDSGPCRQYREKLIVAGGLFSPGVKDDKVTHEHEQSFMMAQGDNAVAQTVGFLGLHFADFAGKRVGCAFVLMP